MNSVCISGRLTRDPEVRSTQGGTFVASFTVAVDRRFKREGEPTADFLRCVAFGKTAEFIDKYFSKGKMILLTGRIQTGQYTDKDGKTVYTTDIIPDNVEFGESKGESKPKDKPQEPPAGPAPDDWITIPEGEQEDLPFL